MRSNRLQLNSDKMEFMWCATVRRQHSLPTVGPLIKSSTVTPSSAVRDLGVYIDSGLTMQSHVRQTVSRCFAVLLQLRTVCRQVPPSVFQSLIVALSLSRLDYCNSVLFGLPANLIQRLQSVQNAAAWLTFRIRRSEHITPALISLHWLRVPERISFKLAVMTYRSIHGTSPSYHRRRLFILSTGAQLTRLYQSNVYYRSKMCLRPLNITNLIEQRII